MIYPEEKEVPKDRIEKLLDISCGLGPVSIPIDTNQSANDLDKRAEGKVVSRIVRNNRNGVDGHYSVAIFFSDDTYIEIIGNYGEGVTLDHGEIKV